MNRATGIKHTPHIIYRYYSTHIQSSQCPICTPSTPNLFGRPSQAHVAAAFRAAREAGWTLKAHLENLDEKFSDSIAMPQRETTPEAALPVIISASPPAPPPAAPPAALSHIHAQPAEEPPQEQSSPPRSRQPATEPREAPHVQRPRISQLIRGSVVAKLICGPLVYEVGV